MCPKCKIRIKLQKKEVFGLEVLTGKRGGSKRAILGEADFSDCLLFNTFQNKQNGFKQSTRCRTLNTGYKEAH